MLCCLAVCPCPHPRSLSCKSVSVVCYEQARQQMLSKDSKVPNGTSYMCTPETLHKKCIITYLFWHSAKSHATPTCQLDMRDILLQDIHRRQHTLVVTSLTRFAFISLTRTWVLLVKCCCASVQDNCQAGKAAAKHNPYPSTFAQHAAVSTTTFSNCISSNASIMFRFYAYPRLSACTGGPHRVAWFYPLAWLSTSMHECPPTCKGVHQPARVSSSLSNMMCGRIWSA